METVYLIAGNQMQAVQFIKDHFLVRSDGIRFVYVDGRDKLRGLENPNVLFIGTYRDRPDWPEIRDILITRIR